LHHRLLADGAASVVGVEFNFDYLTEAQAIALELGHQDRVTYLQGDFMDLASRIEPADVTVLDRVVHCYQEPERLVRQSAAHTRCLYGLSYPRNTWRMRWIIRMSRVMVGLARLPWTPRFSLPDHIRSWIRSAGLQRLSHSQTGMWHTEVYARLDK
jgi:magnesium-protoporphyrin O-methyltransferase